MRSTGPADQDEAGEKGDLIAHARVHILWLESLKKINKMSLHA